VKVACFSSTQTCLVKIQKSDLIIRYQDKIQLSTLQNQCQGTSCANL